MRTAAHVVLTPIVLYFGWTLLGGFAVGISGQPVDGTGMGIVGLVALLMLPLGVWLGWRQRHR